MLLIEGQMCVFSIKRRQIRSNRIRIESARVRGSNKDVFFSRFFEDGKDFSCWD